MRKPLFLVLIISFFSLYSVSNLQSQDMEVEETVQNYFEYLKLGDVEGILGLLTEPLLSERRDLLENNPSYPEFLRKIYKNADTEIINIEKADKYTQTASVEIYFGNQDPPLKTKFIMKRENDSWKISEEIND